MELILSPYKLDFITRKQEELYEMFDRKGLLVDPELVALSQELDRLINMVQNSKHKKNISA